MNFVQQLEECLRDLATASRQKHPGVKEASERAVMKLRTLQTGYVSAVRKAASQTNNNNSNNNNNNNSVIVEHPTTSMFQSSEILHPFLLAANYPNADYKLLEISFRALRLLMEADAIVPTDGIHIVRVYQIQAQVVTAYYHKLYPTTITTKTTTLLSRSNRKNNNNNNNNNHRTDSNSDEYDDDDDEHDEDYEGSYSSQQTDNTTTSSWFSWATGSASSSQKQYTAANTNSKTRSIGRSSTSSSTTITATQQNIKNAVSSSTGKTGGQTTLSGTLMEKLALEILSSLLQLMELLRIHPLVGLTNEVWYNSISLTCLWFFLPYNHTISQAAHSTLSQIISLLYQTCCNNNNNNNEKLVQQTWDDLLTLSCSDEQQYSMNNKRKSGMLTLHGAFKLCKYKQLESSSTATKNVAIPPTPELALELMIEIWKDMIKHDNNFKPNENIILKTMGITMNLLKYNINKQHSDINNNNNIEKSLRIIQWTLILIQSQTITYENECRELFLQMIKNIPLATDACRKHHDFEDGYILLYDIKNDNNNNNTIDVYNNDSNSNKRQQQKQQQQQYTDSNSTTSCFPTSLLWKASFVLEAVYHILDQKRNQNNHQTCLSIFLNDGITVQGLAEALSDYATIGTSCRNHIIQVENFCITQNPSNMKPTIFRKAESVIATGSVSSMYDKSSVVSGSINSSSTSSKDKNNKSSTITQQILGESMWLSLQCLLRIVECLHKRGEVSSSSSNNNNNNVIFKEIFSPSLAVLQHILKRFVASNEMVRLALHGYTTLADTCLPMNECDMERKVLLSSLSKLALPAWGKHDPTSLLQDHHVRALLCLLRVIHLHYDCISTEWEVILWTFEELSVLEIASPLLSDETYHASLTISEVFTRFASFSTCFSDKSLIAMTEALSEICAATMSKRDVVGDSETVLPERHNIGHHQRERSYSSDDHGGDSTISGKIMSMGVRAIYGNVDTETIEEIPRPERTKKAYYEDYRSDFVSRLSGSKTAIRINAIGRIPFALILLSDIAMTNVFRSKDCSDKIAQHLTRLSVASPASRPFIMDITTMLMMCQLSSGQDLPHPFRGPGKVVFEDPMHSQLLAAVPSPEQLNEANTHHRSTQAEILTPLCETILTTPKADVAKSSLEVLTTILEGNGQSLSGQAWPVVIDSIASLSGNSSYDVDRTSSEWSSCCMMAFRSLKMIVDDFLDLLPSAQDSDTTTHISLLDCCASFVGSRHDINTSLTAIGLLWTIADQDSGSDAIDRALSKLVLIAADDRPEVRNAAVNTLFSCIAGRGSGFSSVYWKSCMCGTLFGVYEIVTGKANADDTDDEINVEKGPRSRYHVRQHHSRDSAGKMWLATQVLVLRGLIRVLRNFFFKLLDTCDIHGDVTKGEKSQPWFYDAWLKILDFGFEAASQSGGRETLDIRSVGVELLVVCCQLASKAGIQAAVTPARVGTNMEVVNGALRSVRESQTSTVAEQREHSDAIEKARQKLFSEAYKSIEAFEENVLRSKVADDDTDIQILHRFCTGLSKVYECCREHEFYVDNAKRSIEAICKLDDDDDGKTESTPDDDELEIRFVRIIMSALEASGGDPKARFLNQGQRASLDILRAMASFGSALAFERLVKLSGSSFFVRKDTDGEESECGDEDMVKLNATLLNFEAAIVISQEIVNEMISDECRCYVLYMILTDFLTEFDYDVSAYNEPKPRKYYKRFVPIIRSALESCRRLASANETEISNATDIIWAKMLKCLSVMLHPIPLGKLLIKIPRVSEVITVVNCAKSCVPQKFSHDLCSVLSFGASKAFEAARQHAISAEANPESDFGRKSRRHRDDLLKLWYACFSGGCSLDAEDADLRSLAQTVLVGALDKSQASIHKLCVDASLVVCKSIQENQKMESLVIFVFPSLCQLVINETGLLKEEAGKILINTNVGETLNEFQRKNDAAEARAKAAEQRIIELEQDVEQLKADKARLEKTAKESEGRKGLWHLG